MIRFCRYALLFTVFACLPVGAEAQVETGRGAALDHLGAAPRHFAPATWQRQCGNGRKRSDWRG